jgi:hypothetical protein
MNQVPKGRIAMTHIFKYLHTTRLMALVLALSMLITGCTVTLVSRYDEQTDANITALQKKFETYFMKIEGSSFPDCSFAANRNFYDDVSVQLSSTRVRANAIPKNEITLGQLDALSQAITAFEKAQKLRDGKSSCLPAEIIQTDRTMFNSIFTALLKFELAKKRGEI